ncbi:transducin beta-like protein 2 [Ctenocephalides felis]|uniref:transducin beta-like protein 2 n=1 Tax=Ctenocephalides felis TaxID=7515 RepID=UPI000E6E4E40|nr:transducin beta-like protein 2 [Ctenocephalides felis]
MNQNSESPIVACFAVGKPPIYESHSSVHRTVFVWSLTSLPATRSFRINVPYDHATRVCWSPDNKALLVHTYQESTIMVFKLDKCKKDKESWFSGANNAITFPKVFDSECIGLQISSDGHHVMSCSKDGKLVLFDTKGNVTQKIEDTGLGSNHCARLSPNAKFVIVCGFSPDVKLWTIGDDKDKASARQNPSSGSDSSLKRAFELTGHSGSVCDVAFEMQTLQVASVSKADGWRLYDIDVNYKKGQSPILLKKAPFQNASGNVGADDEVSHVALSPDSSVICVSQGSDLMFYETEGGSLDRCIEKVYSTGPITGVKFDSTGKYVFCTGDKHVRIFHNVTGYKIEIKENLNKLKHNTGVMNSATSERISKTIEDSRKFLESIGEEEWK